MCSMAVARSMARLDLLMRCRGLLRRSRERLRLGSMAGFARARICMLCLFHFSFPLLLSPPPLLLLTHPSFKALALGADFIQLGRPILWGLAHGGEQGVRHVLKSLLAEFEITVGLAGCAKLADVNATLLTETRG